MCGSVRDLMRMRFMNKLSSGSQYGQVISGGGVVFGIVSTRLRLGIVVAL